MPRNNVYDIHEYRRRRAFRLNKPLMEEDTPEVRLEASMERIEDYIENSGRIVLESEIQERIITIEKCNMSRDSLIAIIHNSHELRWKNHAPRYLAIIRRIRELKPPTTNP